MKRYIEFLENSDTRNTYERRIEEAEIMENRDLDSKVAVINEIIKKTVETVIPVCIYSFYCINKPVDKPQLSYMVNKIHKIY